MVIAFTTVPTTCNSLSFHIPNRCIDPLFRLGYDRDCLHLDDFSRQIARSAACVWDQLMTTIQLAWSVSLIFAMCGVGTLILDENPARELKRRLSYSRDRSKVKPRLAELNRGDLAAYEEFRFMQFTYTTTCSLIDFALFLILSRDLGVAVTIVCVRPGEV